MRLVIPQLKNLIIRTYDSCWLRSGNHGFIEPFMPAYLKPPSAGTFRKLLKTHLFPEAFRTGRGAFQVNNKKALLSEKLKHIFYQALAQATTLQVRADFRNVDVNPKITVLMLGQKSNCFSIQNAHRHFSFGKRRLQKMQVTIKPVTCFLLLLQKPVLQFLKLAMAWPKRHLKTGCIIGSHICRTSFHLLYSPI